MDRALACMTVFQWVPTGEGGEEAPELNEGESCRMKDQCLSRDRIIVGTSKDRQTGQKKIETLH